MNNNNLHPLTAYRGWLLLLFAILILLEVIWNWRKQKHNYNVKESLANTSIFLGLQLSKFLTAGYQLVVLGFFSNYVPFHFTPTLWVFLLTFFFIDFLYYWYHRLSHNIKFFWAFHLVHHSSPWMNLTTSYRLNWLSGLISPFFFLPAVFLGFPPAFVAGSFAVNLLYQFFMHTEVVGKLPLVEGIIDTPSAHRVHHGSNPLYIDKNFGGVLMIWDRIFGTYQPETEVVKYGITTGFVSHNPVKLIFHGFVDFMNGRMNYKG